MNKYRRLIHAVGLILFFIGIFIGILIAGSLTWANLEAFFYFGYGIQGDRGLKVSCPLVMAPTETGTAVISISNPSKQQINPHIKADISGPIFPSTSETWLTIDPGQRQTASWEIGSGNVTFGHLILAQVYQFASYPLSSAKGYCGTLVLGLHGLTGKQFFALILAASLFGIIGGFILAAYGRRLLGERKTEERGGMLFLCGFVLASILAGVMAWWLVGVLTITVSVLLITALFGRRIIVA